MLARAVLMSSVATVIALAAVNGARAQDAAPTDSTPTTPSNIPPTEAQSQPGSGGTGEIVVTGSRIRRDPLSLGAAVTFIDRAAIDRTGLTSTADLLQRLPISGGGLNTRNNLSGNLGNPPDGGGVGAGSATIDLRYLGPKRTLVLLDGQRLVPGASASGVPSAVDLNIIPNGAVERIEVLQDGASPIYGSDAIAGVVNIITKKKQRGFDGSAQYSGYFEKGDGAQQDYQLSYGAGNDRVNIVAGGSYTKQDPVGSGARSLSAFPAPYATSCAASGAAGVPCSRTGLFGRYDINGLPVLALKTFPISGRPRFTPGDPTGAGSDFTGFGTPNRFNYRPFNYLLTPNERYGAFVNATAELAPAFTVKLKAIYNHRESDNQAAPLPLVIGPAAGNNNLLDTITIDATNPYNPFGTLIGSGPTQNYSAINRRLIEAGPRHFSQYVDTMYLSGGFEGNFNVGERKFFYDVNAITSYNDARQTFTGNVNAANVAQALGPLANCTGACVPLDLFGGAGTITPDQLGFIGFTERDRSKQYLFDVTANVTGDLFQLPGGPLGIAAGFEHRFQRGSFDPDPIIAAGLGADIPAQPYRGTQESNEAYLELRAPLLSKRPFFDLLEGSFAVRYSDYKRIGDSTNIKGGVLWRPSPDLTLRGNYAEGFRAPSIGELNGAQSRFDQAGLTDPCSGLSAATPATVRANCIAVGVPANGSYVQADQLGVITRGNPNLKPERSKSYTAGVVFSPSFLRNTGFSKRLDLEVDYYDITIKNAINPFGANILLNRCASTLDPASCSAISRAANGEITAIRTPLANFGSVTTNGLDITLTYRSPDTGLGNFGLYVAANHLFHYTETYPDAIGNLRLKREGTERGSPDQAYPKWKGYGTIDWSYSIVNASVTGRYIDSVVEDQANNRRLRDVFYTDVTIGFRPPVLNNRLLLSVGVNNVANVATPGCVTCSSNNYDPGTYDLPGRYGFVRLTYRAR